MSPILTPTDAQELDRASLALLRPPFCPVQPYFTQARFLMDMDEEAFFGGAVGGAKSWALLMGASQFLYVPGYSALILRKTFADLNRSGALMDIAQQWWSPYLESGQVRFDRPNHTYIFKCPGGGTSKIQFGGVATVSDRYKYQGGAWLFCVTGDTPIYMADGSWRSIVNVKVGDLVMTLDGPRPVTATHQLGTKPVTRLTTSAGASVRVGPGHRVLAYPRALLSTQYRGALGSDASLLGSSSGSVQPAGRSLSDQLPTWLPVGLAPQDRRHQETLVSAGDRHNGCAGSEDGRLVAEPPLPSPFLAVLHAPAVWSTALSAQRHGGQHGGRDLPFPDWPSGYPHDHDCDGGLSHHGPATALDSIRRQGDVVVLDHSRWLQDGLENTQPRIHKTPAFPHPYTRELVVPSAPCLVDQVSIAPAGEAEVFDLTVASASHYITWGGLANKNCGFDELTQFEELDYSYIAFSRRRRPSTGLLAKVPMRVRSTGNPGGIGHQWVHDRFIAPTQAYWAGTGPEPQRIFHPSRLIDNPGLDRATYVKSLMELDPVTRSQLLEGDWNIRPEGRMFKPQWFKRIARHQLPGNCRWIRAWDFAATEPSPHTDPDFTVGLRMARSPDGRLFIDDMRRWRLEPADNDLRSEATVLWDTRRIGQVVEKDPGAAGKITIRHLRDGPFRTATLHAVPSSGKSRGRVTTIKAGRNTPQAKLIAAGPFASRAHAGVVYVVHEDDGTWGWDIDAFFDELGIVPDGLHDDILDAVATAYNWLVAQPPTALKAMDGYVDGLESENYWAPPAMRWNSDWETGWQHVSRQPVGPKDSGFTSAEADLAHERLSRVQSRIDSLYSV